MKTSHIIALIVIGIAISIVLTTFDSTSAYVTFAEAKAMADDGNESDIHVVGTLRKDSLGNVLGMTYDPVQDPNYFSFVMVDDSLNEQKVVFYKPKPADLEKSEKVVIIGNYQKGTFVAKQILLKCPSKYNDAKLKENS